MTEDVIVVEGLRKSFRGVFGRRSPKVALDCIDLVVRRGEIFGLLGPNGAGKTTLIKILCGLVAPDAGQARVNGIDVATDARAVRKSVGVVYGDERSFFLRITLLENLRFYARLYGLDRADQRIQELLGVVGLSEVANVRMHGFSSGMRQRAAIARGLLNDPDLIFMDEPSRALDPVGAADLHRLITERVADGRRTVILATNLMHEAESLCHRLALIDRGRVVMTGDLEAFRAQLGQAARYRLLVFGGRGDWEQSLQAVPGVTRVTVQTAGEAQSVELETERRSRALAHAIRHLVEAGAEIWSCDLQEPSLDEVFQAVVRRRIPKMAVAAR